YERVGQPGGRTLYAIGMARHPDDAAAFSRFPQLDVRHGETVAHGSLTGESRSSTWPRRGDDRVPHAYPSDSPRISASTPSSSSGFTRTSRAFEPSLGPTMFRDSMRSMSRPALAKPTRSLRWSMDVDPNWVETTSSAAW